MLPRTLCSLFEPLVSPGYLSWPSQTDPWCQRQCSCCNLGQAIYKASSQVQAQGARGRQRDGRIKECLQGRETDLQSVGEKERGRTERRGEAAWRRGNISGERVCENGKRERKRVRFCQVQRTAWIPEEQTPAIKCKWRAQVASINAPSKPGVCFIWWFEFRRRADGMKCERGNVAAAAFSELDERNVDR